MTTKPRIELEFIAPHTAIVKVTTGNETVEQFMHIPGYDSPVPAGSYTRTDEEGWQARAEKAEQALTEIAQGGALTSDDITDEMVLRFLNAYDRLSDGFPEHRSLAYWTAGRVDLAKKSLAATLTAPARDPRAEEMQADLATAEEPEMDDEDRRLIADHLAALGYRKTGAES